MNNSSENQQNAKQANLDNQQAKMLEHYKSVTASERAAIIRQIDSFLPVTHSESGKTFWIEFRDSLKKLDQPSISNQ